MVGPTIVLIVPVCYLNNILLVAFTIFILYRDSPVAKMIDFKFDTDDRTLFHFQLFHRAQINILGKNNRSNPYSRTLL